MKHPFNKKRFWTVVCVLAVIDLLVCFLVLQRKHIFASRDVSELYSKYSGTPGIDASFIKNFRVNDTVFVDVTLLEISDSSEWETVCKDLGMVSINLFPEKTKKNIFKPHSFIFFYLPSESAFFPDTCAQSKDMVFYSYYDRVVSVFHTQNEGQRDAIMDYKLHEIKKRYYSNK